MFKLDFSKEYILEDDYVRLIPLGIEHISSLLPISNETNLWTYFIEKGNGHQNLTAYVQYAITNRKLKKEYPFIVFDKLRKQYAGTTRFYDYSNSLKNIKLGHTWYGQDFRGTGLNKHCKYLILEFAFEQLGVERIGFGAHMDNTISIAAMQSIGCKKEGVLRSYLPLKNTQERADIVLMSILKSEWLSSVKLALKSKLR